MAEMPNHKVGDAVFVREEQHQMPYPAKIHSLPPNQTYVEIAKDVERVLDDAADHLRREEVGELRGEGRDEGLEVSAFVLSDAARRADFPNVSVGRPLRVGRFCADGGTRPAASWIGNPGSLGSW